MRATLIAVAVLAVLAALVHAGSDVLDLVADNFDSVVGHGDGVFVEFFAYVRTYCIITFVQIFHCARTCLAILCT